MNRTDKMGTERIGKLLVRLAAPAVAAQIVNLLYNIVDRIYIGHIADVGATALTGVGLFVPILMLITAFAGLIGSGGAPLAAIAMGQGDSDRAERIMGNCLTALSNVGIFLTVLLLLFAQDLLRFFGASEETLPYALQYSKIYIAGTMATMLTLGLNPFISAQGFATISMMTTVIGAAINIALDPLLIFTFGMGVRGAAVATVFSQLVSSLWIIAFLCGKKTTLKLRRRFLRVRWSVLSPCLALGVSSFVMLSTESLLSIAFNRSLATYGGDLAVGAMTVISSLNSIVIMPIQGVTQGGQPIMSYNFGAGVKARVKETFQRMLVVDAVYACAFCLIVQLFGRPLAGIFTDDTVLQDYAVWAMRIYFAGIFAIGFQVTCQQGFVALGQAKVSLLLACLRKLALLIPLILILPQFMDNQILAVFLAEPVSDILAAIITCTVFFSRFNGILAEGPRRA